MNEEGRHLADPDRSQECGTCAEPWPCQTECWQRMQATVELHQEAVFHYGDDSDVGCTVCGVLDEWPCETVATLTGAPLPPSGPQQQEAER